MGSKVPPKIASFKECTGSDQVLVPLDGDGVDADFLDGTVLGAAGNLGDLFDHVVALDDFAENAVLIIQVRSGCHGNEELAAVGIGSGVGHGEEAGLGVFQGGVELVGEFVAGPATARTFGIAALDHEIRNDAMKNGAVVERLPGFRTIGKGDKVVHGVGRLIGEKLDLEFACGGIECGVNFVGHLSNCNSMGKDGNSDSASSVLIDADSPLPRIWRAVLLN